MACSRFRSTFDSIDCKEQKRQALSNMKCWHLSVLLQFRGARHLLTAVALMLVGTSSGCAINNVGVIAARVEHGHGAVVYMTYAPGVSLRTYPEERGASIGMARRICIAKLDPSSPSRGVYFVALPAYPARCYTRSTTNWGLAVRLSPPDLSISLGYRDTTTLALVNVGDAVAYTVSFDTTHPSATHLEVRQP